MIDSFSYYQYLNSKVIFMITASIVPAQERFNFYPSITTNYQYLEQAVYHFFDRFITYYSGVYWELVTLDHGRKLLTRMWPC